MGYRTFDEMIGQMQMLDADTLVDHWKARGLDFSRLFTKPDVPASVALYNCERQDHKIHDIIDRKLIAQSQGALERGEPVRISLPIRNTDRTTGAMLSGEIAKRYGHEMPPNTIVAKFAGTAGQSFGAVPCPRRHLRARRRRQRLCRQGAFRRPARGAPAGRLRHRPGGRSSSATPCLRRDRRRMLLPRRRRTLRRAQYGRHRRDRGGRRSLLRIYDRRRGGDARPHRAQFRRRHVGGIAYVLDEDGTFASRCNLAMVELEPMPTRTSMPASSITCAISKRTAWSTSWRISAASMRTGCII